MGIFGRISDIFKANVNDGNQHQQGADEGVKEKLYGCVDPLFSTPDSNEEIHRNQHHFEENVEHHQVQREEETDDSAFQNQQKGVIGLWQLVDRSPGKQEGEGEKDCCQQQQVNGNAIQSSHELDVHAAGGVEPPVAH